MSNVLKRFICLKLAVLLTAALLAGCAQSAPKKNQTEGPVSEKAAKTSEDNKVLDPDVPGWKLDTSPVTFKWFLDANWYKYEWNTPVSRYVTEKTGVTINFDVPTGNPNDKLTTLIASNSLPDILSVGFWQPNFKKLMESGMVYALNELADEYDPYFYKVAGDATLKWYKQPDGNTYCMPNEAYTAAQMEETGVTNANQTFLVRKDIYEEIGRPDMRTPEGFINALQMLKESYSTYKGRTIYPLYVQGGNSTVGCYGLEEMLMNFLAIPYEKDGKVYDRYADPEYIRWLKTFRRAYEMNLITMEFFVDTAPQVEQKINNADYFCMIQEWTGVAASIPSMSKDDPDIVYMAVDGPSNSRLEPARVYAGSMTGWLPVFISKNCSKADRAIRFLSYWASEEGQRDFFLGRKGETWDNIDGKDQLKPAVVNDLNTLSFDDFAAKYGAADTYWMLRNPVSVYKWRPFKIPALQQMVDWANEHADFSSGYVKELNPSGNSPEGIAFSKIRSVWGQTLPKLLTAGSDEEFDKLWDDFIEKRDELGFDIVQEYMQKQLEVFKEKLEN